jgi:hypothetical protein
VHSVTAAARRKWQRWWWWRQRHSATLALAVSYVKRTAL